MHLFLLCIKDSKNNEHLGLLRGEFPNFIHAEFGNVEVITDCVVFVSCCILTKGITLI